MNGGVKTALLLSGVALAGCSTANEGLKVRPIANPSAALSNGDALAVARGQFMLGNVGLALEGFRKAQRQNPSDPDVIAGIGDCYAAMGRFDIAEASYEEALSLAPRDHVLLLGLASVLERGGDLKRATDIRAEAARFQQIEALMAAQARARALAAAKAADEVRQLAAASASVTVKVPPARPAEQARVMPPKIAKPVAPAAAPVQQAATMPRAPVAAASAPVVRRAASTVAAAAPVPAALASEPKLAVATLPKQPVTESVTAATPRAPIPAPPVQAAAEVMPPTPALVLPAAEVQLPRSTARASLPLLALDERVASSLPASIPLEIPRPPAESSPPVALPVKLAEPASPRLQRLSGGEVALVTTADASWRPQVPVRTAVRKASAVQTASADSVRWIPLRLSAARPGVQVLNAARSQGLAASARGVLYGRGWRAVGIGNASALRRTSVVFYPANRAALGRRLAAQFGVPAKISEHQNVVLVLGRDSLDKIAGQRRS